MVLGASYDFIVGSKLDPRQTLTSPLSFTSLPFLTDTFTSVPDSWEILVVEFYRISVLP